MGTLDRAGQQLPEVPSQPGMQGELEPIPHVAQLGVGRFAVEQIRQRDQHAAELEEAHAKLEELHALRPKGVVDRVRQRGALKSWLVRHEFSDHAVAERRLTDWQSYHEREHQATSGRVERQLGQVRGLFGTFSDNEKEAADLLLRHHGLSEEIVAACDATDEKGRRNLIDWLSALAEGTGPKMPVPNSLNRSCSGMQRILNASPPIPNSSLTP